jgi:hypothetical protein
VNVVAQPPFMLGYALEYAARGIPVFPVVPRGKRPLTAHGLKDATTDPDQVREWWSVERWPEANLGIPTGIAFDVCDIDSSDALLELNRHGESELAPVARTSRGVHIYYEPSGIKNKVGFLPGCDWRGAGGYVLVPPSLHASGAEYVWESEPGLSPPPVPDWLHALLEPASVDTKNSRQSSGFWDAFTTPKTVNYTAAALEAEARAVSGAAVGTRNDQLNRSTHTLARLDGLDATSIEAVMLAAALDAGLSKSEAEATIESALEARGRA